ncbi:hypothetical protein DRW07_03685 [Alteromonas sediminis]|uniref:Nucleotidyltransferase family protein n=1 Tax=Alteromonas sediminis TaxID=2259342 RepID=A0A3N5Y3C3_9ALTE|nr:nucleotidyltransferase family protein [Alteromonas sediminis]RPJ68517.1 hypothetical protein DRW07_03685 [Alteromonas sediminis]
MRGKLEEIELLRGLFLACHKEDFLAVDATIESRGIPFLKSVCIAHGISGYLVDVVTQSSQTLPANVAALVTELSEYCTQLKIQNGFQEQYIRSVLEELEKKDVDFVLLKGRALQRYLYKKQEFRPASDVDILIKPCAKAKAIEVFTNQGFYNPRRWEPKYIVNQFSQRKVIAPGVKVDFDIHLKISNNPIIDELLPAEEAFCNTLQSRLTPKYALFHAILHMIGHRHQSDCIKAVWLLDIVLLIDLLTEHDWKSFTEITKQKNCLHLVYAAFEEVNSLFPNKRASQYLKEMRASDSVPNKEIMFLLSSPSQAKMFAFYFSKIRGIKHKLNYFLESFVPNPNEVYNKYGRKPAWSLPYWYIKRISGGLFKTLLKSKSHEQN